MTTADVHATLLGFAAGDRADKHEPSVIFIESDEGRCHVLAHTFAEFAARLRPSAGGE